MPNLCNSRGAQIRRTCPGSSVGRARILVARLPAQPNSRQALLAVSQLLLARANMGARDRFPRTRGLRVGRKCQCNAHLHETSRPHSVSQLLLLVRLQVTRRIGTDIFCHFLARAVSVRERRRAARGRDRSN